MSERHKKDRIERLEDISEIVAACKKKHALSDTDILAGVLFGTTKDSFDECVEAAFEVNAAYDGHHDIPVRHDDYRAT